MADNNLEFSERVALVTGGLRELALKSVGSLLPEVRR